MFFSLGGPIFSLSAEKRTKRSSNCGLSPWMDNPYITLHKSEQKFRAETTPQQLEYATQKRTIFSMWGKRSLITDMHELWKLNCQSLWSSNITTHFYVLNLDHKRSVLCLSKEMLIILGVPRMEGTGPYWMQQVIATGIFLIVIGDSG